jgi:hypothetical protein
MRHSSARSSSVSTSKMHKPHPSEEATEDTQESDREQEEASIGKLFYNEERKADKEGNMSHKNCVLLYAEGTHSRTVDRDLRKRERVRLRISTMNWTTRKGQRPTAASSPARRNRRAVKRCSAVPEDGSESGKLIRKCKGRKS